MFHLVGGRERRVPAVRLSASDRGEFIDDIRAEPAAGPFVFTRDLIEQLVGRDQVDSSDPKEDSPFREFAGPAVKERFGVVPLREFQVEIGDQPFPSRRVFTRVRQGGIGGTHLFEQREYFCAVRPVGSQRTGQDFGTEEERRFGASGKECQSEIGLYFRTDEFGVAHFGADAEQAGEARFQVGAAAAAVAIENKSEDGQKERRPQQEKEKKRRNAAQFGSGESVHSVGVCVSKDGRSAAGGEKDRREEGPRRSLQYAPK